MEAVMKIAKYVTRWISLVVYYYCFFPISLRRVLYGQRDVIDLRGTVYTLARVCNKLYYLRIKFTRVNDVQQAAG